MGRVVDITANKPHKVSEVICLKCMKRWIYVRPEECHLKDETCPYCEKTGFIINTGDELFDNGEE